MNRRLFHRIPDPLAHSARWEFALVVAICAVWVVIALAVLGYMDMADERTVDVVREPPAASTGDPVLRPWSGVF